MIKKEKVPKVPKMVAVKKLPKLLRKTYTHKAFQKKIIKHLYIEHDKQLITSVFKEDVAKPGCISIPTDTTLPLQDFKRLKLIAKQIKKQKGTFKLVPFAAVVIFLAAVGIGVTLFKNTIVKMAMTQGMQSVFGAKTDIASVDLQIFNASLQVKGIQQADKSSPMKNLFQIDTVAVDFNLTELLRGKFDAQNIAVTGVAIGTDRTTSGELPQKAAQQSDKQEEKQQSAFATMVSGKASTSLGNAKDSLINTFSQYNPQNVINNLSTNLSSPKLSQEIQSEVEALIPKWQDKPDEIKHSVEAVQSSVQTLIDKDWSSISNVAELTQALNDIQKAIDQVQTVKNQTNTVLSELKSDTAKVKKYSAEINAAITKDQALVQKELNRIKSFSIDGTKTLISDALNSAAYSALGKYYPYVQKGIGYAKRMKSSSNPNKESAKVKAKKTRRAAGRYVYYKKNTVPRFLIENLAASGTSFEATVKEVSNDQDIRGLPASAQGTLTLAGYTHSIATTVDTRTNTQSPLIAADYSTKNFPIAASLPILAVNSSSAITAAITADENGGFTADISCLMKDLAMTSDSFEPEFAYNIYKKALASVKAMNVQVQAAYSEDNGLSLTVNSDADKQLADALKRLMNEELDSIKADAQKEIAVLLKEQTKGATDRISEYLDIDSLLNGEGSIVDNLTKQLNSKQDEIRKEIQQKTTNAVKEQITEKATEFFKGLF
ncbi:MAG: TIGR03545 family protein [Treponema sp.]|nr:TIGR03545 family protein [Treponema sp.]